MSAVDSHAQITDVIPFSSENKCKTNDLECYGLEPREPTYWKDLHASEMRELCDETVFTTDKIQTLIMDYIEVSPPTWNYHYIATGCPFTGTLSYSDKTWRYYFYATGYIFLTPTDTKSERIYLMCKDCLYDPSFD